MLLHEDHAEHALAVLVEARELRPDDGAIALTMADALIRLGDLDGARAQLDGIAPGTSSHQLAHAKRVLMGLIADDADAVRAAIDELRPVADGLYATAYEPALAAATDPAGAVPELPAGADRAAALDAVMELAAHAARPRGARDLQRDGAAALRVAESRRDVDGRLGYLLYVNDFPDPAADRLIAADRGRGRHPRRLRRARADLPVEEPRRGRRGVPAGRPGEDDQNMSRHIDLAGVLAGAGRYADADAVLREGLMVYPHSSVLRELRQSMSLLAGAGV